MSSEVVVCPQCGMNLQNSAAVAGQVVACPQCQTQLQMPILARAAAMPQLPLPDALPPAIELPPSIDLPPAVDHSGAVPIVHTTPGPGEPPASVSDRLRKRSNPLAIFFAVVLVMVLVVVGVVAVRWDRNETAKKQFANQMIGNWELVPGQSQLERWDFAFHVDRKLQMALGTELNEGRWSVTNVEDETGYVLIRWPDDVPETMRVKFEAGTMHVELDSVGAFAFRRAGP